jgi:hypothetical protein
MGERQQTIPQRRAVQPARRKASMVEDCIALKAQCLHHKRRVGERSNTSGQLSLGIHFDFLACDKLHGSIMRTIAPPRMSLMMKEMLVPCCNLKQRLEPQPTKIRRIFWRILFLYHHKIPICSQMAAKFQLTQPELKFHKSALNSFLNCSLNLLFYHTSRPHIFIIYN